MDTPTIQQEPRLITPKTIYKAVTFDRQTRLWFKELCLTPEISGRLQKTFPELKNSYANYHQLTNIACSLIAISTSLLLVTAFVKNAPMVSLAGTSFLMFLSAIIVFSKRQRSLATIASKLIEADMEKIPPATTLYQFAEIYSRQYNMLSMIDLMWVWDYWLRSVVLTLYFLVFLVYNFNFWVQLAIIITGMLVTLQIIHIFLMLKKKPHLK